MSSSGNLYNDHVFYAADGLWDVTAGLALLLVGVTLWAGLGSYNGVLAVLLYALLLGLKRAITVPRLSPRDISAAQRSRARRAVFAAVLGVAVFMLTGLAIYLLDAADSLPARLTGWLELYLGHTLVFVAVTVLSVLGTLFQAQRLHGYAAAVLVVFIASLALQLSLPVFCLLLGTIVLLTGVGLVRGFARSHPPLPPGRQLGIG